MENEGFIDTIINAIKYGISNGGSLLWGGVVAVLSMFLIGIPFMAGYMTRCARNLLKGDNRLPAWDDLGGLLKDGIMVIVIGIVYCLIGGLFIAVALPFFIAGAILESNLLMILGVVILVPAILIVIALSMLFYLSWMEYAATGDLVSSLNPVRGLKLIASNPVGYILALVMGFIISLLASIPASLIITIPWVNFVTYAALAYVYVRFYQSVNRPAAGTLTSVPAPA